VCEREIERGRGAEGGRERECVCRGEGSCVAELRSMPSLARPGERERESVCEREIYKERELEGGRERVWGWGGVWCV